MGAGRREDRSTETMRSAWRRKGGVEKGRGAPKVPVRGASWRWRLPLRYGLEWSAFSCARTGTGGGRLTLCVGFPATMGAFPVRRKKRRSNLGKRSGPDSSMTLCTLYVVPDIPPTRCQDPPSRARTFLLSRGRTDSRISGQGRASTLTCRHSGRELQRSRTGVIVTTLCGCFAWSRASPPENTDSVRSVPQTWDGKTPDCIVSYSVLMAEPRQTVGHSETTLRCLRRRVSRGITNWGSVRLCP